MIVSVGMLILIDFVLGRSEPRTVVILLAKILVRMGWAVLPAWDDPVQKRFLDVFVLLMKVCDAGGLCVRSV